MLFQRERTRASATDPVASTLDRFDALQAGMDPDSLAWRAEAARRAKLRLARVAGPCGRRLAEGALTHARGRMPAPAPLPSLRDALAMRASVFGPFDDVPDAPSGPAVRLGELARHVVDRLARKVLR